MAGPSTFHGRPGMAMDAPLGSEIAPQPLQPRRSSHWQVALANTSAAEVLIFPSRPCSHKPATNTAQPTMKTIAACAHQESAGADFGINSRAMGTSSNASTAAGATKLSRWLNVSSGPMAEMT